MLERLKNYHNFPNRQRYYLSIEENQNNTIIHTIYYIRTLLQHKQLKSRVQYVLDIYIDYIDSVLFCCHKLSIP